MRATRVEQLNREELEHERTSEEFHMLGLGFEGGLLEQLQQQGKLILYSSCSIASLWIRAFLNMYMKAAHLM